MSGEARTARSGRVLSAVFPPGIDRRGLAVLSFGHIASDIFQGGVPALVPFLIRERGYSFAAAGALVLMAGLGSSLVQPLFGLVADRVRIAWSMPAGVLLAGGGLAAAGVAPSYASTAAALLVGGIGVAAFHPEAVRFATYVSTARRGTGISLFAVGGNAGFALGPILVTPVAVTIGLQGMPIVAAISLLGAILLGTHLRYLERFRPESRAVIGSSPPVEADSRWGQFALASGSAFGRTAFQFALMTFVPVWFALELASSEAVGNAAVAGMLVGGAFGTLIGGRLADRYGFRPTVVWSLLAVLPLAFALPRAGVVAAFVLMVGIGIVMDVNFYPLVILATSAVPRHLGFAAGVVIGISISAGAGAVALLGFLADSAGVEAALWGAAGLLALAFVLSLGTRPNEQSTALAAAEGG